MKKKFLAIILAVLCVFATMMFSACGNKDGNTIVVGVTDYEPMDYKENGEWTGFDYELAKKAFESLGYKVEFMEIDWDTKIITLNSKEIDCIWNGMTITSELQENILLTDPYLRNKQYGLVKNENAASYTDASSLTGKTIAVEAGSAGEGAVENANAKKINKMSNQNAAVLEVSSGTSDIAIVDMTLANTLTSAGSDYFGKLTKVDLGFETENFAVGFRKADTELCGKINDLIKTYAKDGTMSTLAEKYGVENLLIAD